MPRRDAERDHDAHTESDTTPYWSTSTTFPHFAKLADDAEADVVVVGAGITGLTAAYLLAKAGTRVIPSGRITMLDGHRPIDCSWAARTA